MAPLQFDVKELPVEIVVRNDRGEREVYQLMPAGRKLGASLQKVVGQFRDLVLRMIDRR